MRLGDILELPNFYESVKDCKMPLKTVYKLTRLMKRAEEEIQFYQSEFNKIIELYGRKEKGEYVLSDDKKSIQLIPGKEAECFQKISELQNLEIDLSGLSFKIEEFENFNLTISQMAAILPFIQD